MLNRPRIENDVRNLARKLFKGLEYLHSLGIGHRDIKFENIMVSTIEDDATPKFIDFGLSKVSLYGEYSQDRFGTLAYSSPEILLGQNHHLGVDIWSMGILLYVLLSGTFPFLASDKNMTKRNIVFEKLNFNLTAWKKVSHNAKDTISWMLEKREQMRPSIVELKQHPWFCT